MDIFLAFILVTIILNIMEGMSGTWRTFRFLNRPVLPGAQQYGPEGLDGSFGPADTWPPVSILKPVKGLDPEAASNFESFYTQDYPGRLEMVVASEDREDPALEVIRAVARAHPEIPTRFVRSAPGTGRNGKVANLLAALEEARYEHLLLSDADTRVAPDFLCKIMAPLSSPEVGASFAIPYISRAAVLPAALFALFVNVTATVAIISGGPVPFAGSHNILAGAAVATTRNNLQRAGGLENIEGFIAEDLKLGELIAGAGLALRPVSAPVESPLTSASWSEVWDVFTRWFTALMKMRPWLYALMPLRFAHVHAAVYGILARGQGLSLPLAFLPLAALLLMRVAWAFWVGRYLFRDRATARWSVFMPLADLLVVILWLRPFLTTRVRWRGRQLVVGKGGSIREP
ncbi:MAG: glycosyltransferase [Firmicutes bacterium]|nr:glycosyltransferase [Bacillota bacterium]